MPLSIKVNLRVTGHCNQGGRKYMEDMFSVAYQQTSDDKDLEYAFFGIFDGHGGGEAAKFAKDHLMDIIVKQKNFWSDKDEDVLRAIRDGYVNTHYAMWRELDKWPRTASGLPSTAGTTASIAFIRKGKIYIGHVGDSGIILGYQDEDDPQWKAKPLTKDHKPESGPEMTRIQESGGKVISKSGVPRVVWNRPRIGHKGPVRRSTHIDEIPFLAVARSLGDLWSYNSELDTFVVSPEPDVKVIKVDVKSYRCLIFGTDGLWNMLTPQAAVAIVQAAERHNEKHFIASQQTGNLLQGESQMWINPSKSLVDRALERWSSTRLRADNTSVVTLMIDPPGPSRCEVLMNRRQKESVSSVPESIPTPLSHPCNPNFHNTDINKIHPPTANVVETPNPIAASTNVQSNLTSEELNQTVSPSSSSFELNESLPSDYSFQENSDNRESFVDNSRYDKVNDDDDDDNNDTILSESSVKESTIMENIQVAEISSSDISSDDVGQVSVDDTINKNNKSVEENTDDNTTSINDCVSESSVDDSLIETTATEEKIPEKDSVDDTERNNYELTREKAFFGTWDSFNSSGSKQNQSSNSDLADLISNSTPVAEINSTDIDSEKEQREDPSLSSNLDKHPPDLSTDINNDDTVANEVDSAKTSPQLTPATSTSSTNDKKMSPPASVDTMRLKRRRSIPLKRGSTRRTKEIVSNKRRHSSTLDEAENPICSVPEVSNAKRRTRSEDRRCDVNGPTDENNPINQEQSQQQQLRHDRVRRWPGNLRCSVVSKIRNVNSPTTSYSPSTNPSTPSNTREKMTVSPTSFQRRSLEKKATPVKTIRRPSINGSNRVQLRGSFALRDWDQTKSNHRRRRSGVRAGNCSSDRSRLNHVINDGSSITADPTTSSTTPQRWLRSDTIAAIPIKTLRSRNVDIASGHTVPPQLAHQYNIIKQNRLSMPPPSNTKLRMSNTPSKVKTTTITAMSPGITTSGKLKQTDGSIGGANGSSASVSANTVPGIAKRVKSSPYNPSARSLGTRSRLKRLSK